VAKKSREMPKKGPIWDVSQGLIYILLCQHTLV